jgi:hypothetical protein
MRETDKTIEAMKMALEALEWISDVRQDEDDEAGECASCHERSYKPHAPDCAKQNAITALRAAIAEASMQRLTDVQQEMEQEPVAWMLDGKFYTAKEFSLFTLTTKEKLNRIPFYSYPPRREWVELTDEEMFKCVALEKLDALRYLETKLKEKNGG